MDKWKKRTGILGVKDGLQKILEYLGDERELEFIYKNNLFSINNLNNKCFFSCEGVRNFNEELSDFDDKSKLIDSVNSIKIDSISLEKIIDDKLYEIRSLVIF